MPTKRNLFILGAGNFGREIESWFELYTDLGQSYKLLGFLDDNSKALDNFPSDYKIVGSIRDFKFKKDDAVIMAISNPVVKEKILESLKLKVGILTLIAKNAIIGKYVQIGAGTVITPNCIVTTNVKIGQCVILNCGTQVGHDVEIGDFSSLMANIDLGGNVKLGKKVFIGSNATLIPGITVADNTTIGAGSIVINKIKNQQTVFGNPASKI